MKLQPKADQSGLARNVYDDEPTPQLLEFMTQGWGRREIDSTPIDGGPRFRARRVALSRRFPSDVLVIPTNAERVRSNDTHFRFRPGTEFYYLTGCTVPRCLLVMTPRDGGHDETLYFEGSFGRETAQFFTDRMKGELWVGPRLNIEEAAQRYGIPTRHAADAPASIASLVERFGTTRVLRGFDPAVDALARESAGDRELATFLSEMRLIKDDYEIAQLRAAIASTKRGFDDVMHALGSAKSERYVEGVFNLRARLEGNDVGYGTIAASGRHACVLHWKDNDGALHGDDLLLLDAGVETHSLYTADVTRTVPVGGRFSPEQRNIYELVLAAQDAALRACVPGSDFLAPNEAAMNVVARGLERLGILPMAADEALRSENKFYRRYSLHNVSHMLGLDVHDCAKARQEAYKYGRLQPGMVLTIEPGIYLQPDDLTVPEPYRGIGVRIEDDVLVTKDGCDVLTAAFPRATADVERWLSRP